MTFATYPSVAAPQRAFDFSWESGLTTPAERRRTTRSLSARTNPTTVAVSVISTPEILEDGPRLWPTVWLAKSIQDVYRLRFLPKLWESTGAAPPNGRAISNAEMAIRAFADLDIQPSRVEPSIDEGIRIAFKNDARYADVECFNSGDILAITSALGGTPDLWEVDDTNLSSAAAKICHFILSK